MSKGLVELQALMDSPKSAERTAKLAERFKAEHPDVAAYIANGGSTTTSILGDSVAEWNALVAKHAKANGGDNFKALQKAAGENPHLHQQYLDRVNRR